MTLAPPRQWSDPERHLESALGHRWYAMVSRLTSLLLRATAGFHAERDVWPMLTPTTTGAISSPVGLGSDSVPVAVELLGTKTYLVDSLQFQLEALLRHGYRGVYYVMPTFRGEDPDTTHLNQFFHSEAEIVGDLDDVMSLVELYVRHLAREALADSVMDAIAEAARSVTHLEAMVDNPSRFATVTYAEAERLLASDCFDEIGAGQLVINTRGEAALVSHCGEPVWLTHPPAGLVPFYQRGYADGTAASADLLLGHAGEVVGCGERHATGGEIRAALAAHEVHSGAYEWYVRMKDAFPLRTAGFGLGIERLLMWILRHDDIRDLQVMPRLKGHEWWI